MRAVFKFILVHRQNAFLFLAALNLLPQNFSNGKKCVFFHSIHGMSAFSTASSVLKELSVRLDAHNNPEVLESVAL